MNGKDKCELLHLAIFALPDTAYVQAGKFGFVGIINTIVDIAAYYVLTRFIPYFEAHLLLSKFSAFFAGSITSFMLNRNFTFSLKTRPTFSEVVKFYSTIALTVTVNVVTFYVFNTVLGIYDLFAVGLSTIATFAIGFALSKLWVFKKVLTTERIKQKTFDIAGA